MLRAIVEISLKPSIELRQLAKEALSKNLDPDPLLVFSAICRADLDNVHPTVVQEMLRASRCPRSHRLGTAGTMLMANLSSR